jgi:methionyl-tRNA formyltransferase
VSKVRVVFLGTPEFAVTCLKGLVADEHFEVVGVVTQPDRPAGRKMQLQPSEVKNYCLAHGLRVITPDNINAEMILQQIEVWGAEVAVVVAYGQLLTEKFLKLFPLGAVNVHGSLVPRWRGAAPIQRAIEHGDKVTGVALQKIVKKLDAGDVLGVRKVPITEDTDALQLFQQLAQESVEILRVELMDYVRGHLVGEAQDESQVTYAKKIDKSEGELQWGQSAEQLSQKVRAFVMGPGTWTFFNKKKIKIHRVKIVNKNSLGSPFKPGTLVNAEGSELWVQTGEGVLALLELQPESRNRLSSFEFLKGYGLKKGDVLENEEKSLK